MGSRLFAWGVGIGLCLVATAVRVGLSPLLHNDTRYLVHLVAVAAATWSGGATAGAVAAVLGVVMVHVFVINPASILSFGVAEAPGLLLFAGVSFMLVWQVHRWRSAEQHTRATEAELRAMMDAATESIWLFSFDGRILAANATAAKRFRATPGQLVGRLWESFLPPELAASRKAWMEEVRRTRQPAVFEDVRAGMRFSHTFYPVFDAEGAVRAIAAFSQDITDQRRAMDELRELNQRLTYHVTQSPLAVIEWGPDMRLTRWAGAAERVFGWSADEVLGKRVEDLRWVVEDDQQAVRDVSEDLRTGRNRQRFSANRNYRKDGSIAYCEWYNSSLVDDQGNLRSILSLVLDVTERKRLEAEWREQADQLVRANRMKDEFLATLSHELRTPMNAIIGWARMLTTDGVSADLQRRGVDVIMRNAWAQTRLIEDVLDVSRIVTGTFSIQLQEIDASGPIAAALDSIRPAADAKGIALEVASQPGLPVRGDPARLQQVLSNLLSNAVKFTPDGGRVQVCTRLADGQIEITVRDSGVGITPEFLPHVFERFTQADSSSTREHGGLGLGLAVVRHIVELHGGTVTAASDGPGRGATFVVRLPGIS